MAASATAYLGIGHVDIVPEPSDKSKKVESIMASPPPAIADPNSPEYVEGTRCFRSYYTGLGITRFCKRDVQVGNSVIPGEHAIIRFTPIGNADVGELVTNEPEVIAKVEAHPLFKNGMILDAVGAHVEGKRARAAMMAAQIQSDPVLRAALAEAIGSDTVDTWLGAAAPATAEKKPKKPRN